MEPSMKQTTLLFLIISSVSFYQSQAMESKDFLIQLDAKIAEIKLLLTSAKENYQPTNPYHAPEYIEQKAQQLRELLRIKNNPDLWPQPPATRRSIDAAFDSRPAVQPEQVDERAPLLLNGKKEYLTDERKSHVQIHEVPFQRAEQNPATKSLASRIMRWLCCAYPEE